MAVDTFEKRVLRADHGCWEWDGAHTSGGYGETWIDNHVVYAHRVSYLRAVGPIPEGLELDHLCGNRGCVNPEHLEAVTHAENMRRGATGGPPPKSECVNGHPFTDENVYVNAKGRRECRRCRTLAAYRYRARAQGGN